MKTELDNEKYLSSLDKDMKQILNNTSLPDYKKWLKYKQALSKYFDFKRFLEQTKLNKDLESQSKFSVINNRLSELTNKLQNNKNLSNNKEKNSTLAIEKFKPNNLIWLTCL